MVAKAALEFESLTHCQFRMTTANTRSRHIWEAVQLGTVVEIGVRFPAILQHPVLQWKENSAGLNAVSKTVGLYKGWGSSPPPSAI